MNEAVSPVEATPEDESLARHALKDSNLVAEVATACAGAEAPNYPLSGGLGRLVLPTSSNCQR
jgi:hypothetical protein